MFLDGNQRCSCYKVISSLCESCLTHSTDSVYVCSHSFAADPKSGSSSSSPSSAEAGIFISCPARNSMDRLRLLESNSMRRSAPKWASRLSSTTLILLPFETSLPVRDCRRAGACSPWITPIPPGPQGRRRSLPREGCLTSSREHQRLVDLDT